jgi:hypothetical protein
MALIIELGPLCKEGKVVEQYNTTIYMAPRKSMFCLTEFLPRSTDVRGLAHESNTAKAWLA